MYASKEVWAEYANFADENPPQILIRVFQRLAKNRHIDEIHDVEKMLLTHMVMEGTYISQYDLQKAKKSSIFRKTHEKVTKSFAKKEIAKDISIILDQQLTRSIKRLKKKLLSVEDEVLGQKSEELKQIKSLKRRETLRSKLLGEAEANQNFQAEFDLIREIQNVVGILSKKEFANFTFLSFTKTDFDIPLDSASWNRINHISFKIYCPEWFAMPRINYLSRINKIEPSLRWTVARLDIHTSNYLLEEANSNPDKTNELLIQKYSNPNLLSELKENCLVLPAIEFRRDLLEQAIFNHQEGRYEAAINLLLPLIEGVLWDTAIHFHKAKIVEIFAGEPKYFESLLNISDREIPRAHSGVRDLVRQTRLNSYLNPDFIDYFASEIYDERTPILHGMVINYGSALNSCSKLAVLEYIATNLSEPLLDGLEAQVKKVMEEDQINDMLEKMFPSFFSKS